MKLIEFPVTTVILQSSARTGMIKKGISQINNKAKYVDPPPNPTLEYKIAVIKNNIDNINIFKFSYESKYCTVNCNRY